MCCVEQTTKDRRQRTEGRGQIAEDRRQRTAVDKEISLSATNARHMIFIGFICEFISLYRLLYVFYMFLIDLVIQFI